ncbi:hypothetical protein [Sediminibacterium goheungense]|uniref:DUF5723 domain-containing protein n=1 Tax=Sediminibacterium goheungense TaxID=1086393 RepID=A0A4R6J0A6_9BACT|nr:hypothetical protein [Sediminibacterium goheungense]TDO28610.1 hypothetical protein BC659_0686 [Sediminibacterium goheungense]
MMKTLITCLCFLICLTKIGAQSYQSTYGSAFAGSTSIKNNPASSVNSAYKWDLTLFTAQARISTNSLFMRKDSAFLNGGSLARFLHNNVDISLLNFLYKPNNKHAFAFNLRVRSYNHARTAPIFASDSIYSIHDFIVQNRTTPYLEGFVTHSGWLQGDFNYSRILSETHNSRLTGGVTLQVMKNISAAYGRVSKMSYLESKTSTDTLYTFVTGGGAFGYSSNYDETSSGTSSTGKDFLKNTITNFGLSLGVEYLLYAEAPTAYQQNNAINYQWKIGAALMDLGASRYKSSAFSSQFRNVDPGITDMTMDQKFTNIQNGQDLRDSLATVFNNADSVGGKFKIGSPTRLVINVDRSFGNNLYVNADLSINLHGTSGYKRLLTREINLLTITPRWETINWGFYLPIQYNSQGQFHIGAAFKAGPLVLGIHNIQWAKQIKNLSGGGYLMLSIHPFNKKKVVSKLDCPE